MAYTAGKLSQLSLGGTTRLYVYDAGADSMADVGAVGYFNNLDDSLNLMNEDVILAMCADGDAFFRVASAVANSATSSAGSVTTQVMTPAAQYRGVIGSASASISVGITEIGTGTGTAFTGPTPFAGARLTVTQIGTATGGRTIGVSSSGVTLGNSLVTITMNGQGQSVSLLGVSATRWVVTNLDGATLS